jgi:hypothetical protein
MTVVQIRIFWVLFRCIVIPFYVVRIMLVLILLMHNKDWNIILTNNMWIVCHPYTCTWIMTSFQCVFGNKIWWYCDGYQPSFTFQVWNWYCYMDSHITSNTSQPYDHQIWPEFLHGKVILLLGPQCKALISWAHLDGRQVLLLSFFMIDQAHQSGTLENYKCEQCWDNGQINSELTFISLLNFISLIDC